MTTSIVHCDKCGRRIEAGRSTLDVVAGPLTRLRAEVDLCGPCAEAFSAWLAGPAADLARPPAGPRLAGSTAG